MLDQRRRRWAGVVQMLYKCFVFAGYSILIPIKLHIFCGTQWRHSVKTRLYKTPPPYFIVLASSVKIKEVKVIEFHRIDNHDQNLTFLARWSTLDVRFWHYVDVRSWSLMSVSALSFSAGADFSMPKRSDSDVCRRQILTSTDGPRTWTVKYL